MACQLPFSLHGKCAFLIKNLHGSHWAQRQRLFLSGEAGPSDILRQLILPHPHSSCLALHIPFQLEERSRLREMLGWQAGRTCFLKIKYLKLGFQTAVPTAASSSFYFLP